MPPHDLGVRQTSTDSVVEAAEATASGAQSVVVGSQTDENSTQEEILISSQPQQRCCHLHRLEDQRDTTTMHQRRSPPSSQQNDNDKVSRNVTIILVYTWFLYAGRSIWNQNVLATLVYLLKNGDPKAVGYATAAMGLSQLLISFPSGFLADKYRRDIMLRLASVLGIGAMVTTFIALQHTSYTCLVAALCVWGLFWGVANTSLSALFADSIVDGQRAHYFTTRSILVNLGNTTGPTVALIMFLFLGDKWTIQDCCKVMMVGQMVCLPALFLLLFVSDDATVVSHHNNDTANPSTGPQQRNDLTVPLLYEEDQEEENNNRAIALEEDESENISLDDVDIISLPNQTISSNANTTTTTTEDHETFDKERLALYMKCLPKNRAIPILVACGDVTAGLASGMSIRYFSIFLYDNLQMSPVNVQILYIIAPLVQATLMKIAQYIAKGVGRCRTAVIFKWIGITLMVSMVLSYVYHYPIWLTCTILVVRTAFMNSTSALTKSVLMDNIPKEERAKWSALESLNMFSWSGSAALGGILVDYKGIIFNFCVTAFLQLLATAPIFTLSFFSSKRNGTTRA